MSPVSSTASHHRLPRYKSTHDKPRSPSITHSPPPAHCSLSSALQRGRKGGGGLEQVWEQPSDGGPGRASLGGDLWDQARSSAFCLIWSNPSVSICFFKIDVAAFCLAEFRLLYLAVILIMPVHI